MRDDKTALSWWWPRLPKNIPTPRTTIIRHQGTGHLVDLCDGKTPEGFGELCQRIVLAGDRFGWPMFLRTDHFSAKHNWKDTCYVPGPGAVPQHVARLVVESNLVDIMGLPTDVWVIRELLPTEAAFYAFRGEMPIVKERRYFVDGQFVKCHHPYWPPGSIEKPSAPDWEATLAAMNVEAPSEIDHLVEMSLRVGARLKGAWSIDWLWVEGHKKWYLTDMAEAERSFHWPGCEAAAP
jgi:hypothetical protein